MSPTDASLVGPPGAPGAAESASDVAAAASAPDPGGASGLSGVSHASLTLAIYSDLHTEFSAFKPPAGWQADVVVLAGDIYAPGHSVPGWARRKHIFGDLPAVFVAGNHEFYGSRYQREREQMRVQAAQFGVHLLNQGTAVIRGVRFVGCTLWTDFGLRIRQPDGSLKADPGRCSAEADRYLNDYSCIEWEPAPVGDAAAAGILGTRHTRRRLWPLDTLAMHQAERAWLETELARPFDGPTVVVTHHAPHRGSLASVYESDHLSAAFVSDLAEHFFEVPELWIHGHTHTSFDYQVGGCRMVCNPRGYPLRSHKGFENPRFDPMGLQIVVPRPV